MSLCGFKYVMAKLAQNIKESGKTELLEIVSAFEISLEKEWLKRRNLIVE